MIPSWTRMRFFIARSVRRSRSRGRCKNANAIRNGENPSRNGEERQRASEMLALTLCFPLRSSERWPLQRSQHLITCPREAGAEARREVLRVPSCRG